LLDSIGLFCRFARATQRRNATRGTRAPGRRAIVPTKGNIEPAKDEKGYRGENEDFDDNIPFLTSI